HACPPFGQLVKETLQAAVDLAFVRHPHRLAAGARNEEDERQRLVRAPRRPRKVGRDRPAERILARELLERDAQLGGFRRGGGVLGEGGALARERGNTRRESCSALGGRPSIVRSPTRAGARRSGDSPASLFSANSWD